jgi:[ribosomal protein S18]-alanine N-acetyltransferase
METNQSPMAASQSQVRVMRTATVADLEALVSLEEVCFAVPWSRKSFEAELHGNPFSHILVVPGPIETPDVSLVAYICVWVIFEEVRFLNLAVHPQVRRQGLGKQLILQALRIGIDQGCSRGMLEVRHSNRAARTLYESFKFKEYATRNSYYTNPTEDAILMSLEPIAQTISDKKDRRKIAFSEE